MRLLESDELKLVCGAGGSTPSEVPEEGGETPTCTRMKNNNGYGNGPESGPPPGKSGAHNPQLTGWNEGPRGPR